MSEAKTFNEHTADLELRSPPKPVTRINRKVLLAGAGLGALALFVAANLALKPSGPAEAEPAKPVYTKQAKRTPEGLSLLPSSYDAPAFRPAEPAIPLGARCPATSDRPSSQASRLRVSLSSRQRNSRRVSNQTRKMRLPGPAACVRPNSRKKRRAPLSSFS
jgi:hypothetical protein